jgi:hypothetical protein
LRALVNTVMSLRVPQEAERFLNCWGNVSFSKTNLFHGMRYWILEEGNFIAYLRLHISWVSSFPNVITLIIFTYVCSCQCQVTNNL